MLQVVLRSTCRNRRALSSSPSRVFSDAHGWGHGFIHGERQGTCGRAMSAEEEEVHEANAKGKTKWEIRQTGDRGYGVYALRDFPANEVVFRASGLRETTERTSHSVQTDWDRHVHMDLPARFINHSCEANVGVRTNELGAFDFLTVTPVHRDEELTWDYGGAEFNSISIDMCLCGKPKCRGKSLGFETSHKSIRSQYGSFYAQYLHSWEEGSSNAK